MIHRIIVLGGGSAGFIAAVTLKKKLPRLTVHVIRSPDIGVIGVGEGTTAAFPRHFFEFLGYNARSFYEQAEPTWKLGLRFLWGPRDVFYYTFLKEYEKREPALSRNIGFFCEDDCTLAGPCSMLMRHGKAFPRRPGDLPAFHNHHAFHIENKKLVSFLENLARAEGVEIQDATVERVERTGDGVGALILDNGERLSADLYVDASGFRSELLGQTLGESFISYDRSLFCDRAVIGGWPRSQEPILPYTTCETMNHGWAWQIEHEHFINRGYVFSSRFVSDDEARTELLAKNSSIDPEKTRVVKFRAGRYARSWVGNVVAIGNSAGFVEPLEATALQVICVEASTLADSLIDSELDPGLRLIALYNRFNSEQWDEIRDFLAVHYKFNTRLDTEFWRACRSDTDLGEAQGVVDFYQENGPSVVAGPVLLRPTNSFGLDGYLALLIGQRVPHGKPHRPADAERDAWEKRRMQFEAIAQQAMTVRECLGVIRRPGFKWS
jgi:tryptophan halogenase